MVKYAPCNVLMSNRPPFPGLSEVDKHRIMRTNGTASPRHCGLLTINSDDSRMCSVCEWCNNVGFATCNDSGGGRVPMEVDYW